MPLGRVPGFAGAHSQAATLDELNRNLREVLELLLKEGAATLQGAFLGTQVVTIE